MVRKLQPTAKEIAECRLHIKTALEMVKGLKEYPEIEADTACTLQSIQTWLEDAIDFISEK